MTMNNPAQGPVYVGASDAAQRWPQRYTIQYRQDLHSGWWIADLIELSLFAQGRTIEQAQVRARETLGDLGIEVARANLIECAGAPRSNGRQPTTPGQMLREQFLPACGLSERDLIERTGLPEGQVQGICCGFVPVTEEAAARLAAVFGTSPEYWLRLQSVADHLQRQLSNDPALAGHATPGRP